MTQRSFDLTLASMGLLFGGGLYAYAYSLSGALGRAVLSGGLSHLAPVLRLELVALFWRGRHVAPRGVHPVFAGLAGAEGVTLAGLQVPVEVSAYQAAADEEARILAGFERLVGELESTPGYLAAFHEVTASNPVYRAWVLERTGELSREQLDRAIAAGRELVPTS